MDYDCDGTADGNLAEDATDWYEDGDGDGYGNPDVTVFGCDPGNAYVDNDDDCNDGNDTVYPNATEQCDGLDNDCNMIIPSGEMDMDGDGVRGCAGDCNDLAPRIYPGADEFCDGEDSDCDGSIPIDETVDLDGDGVGACDDCDDGDPGSLTGLRVPGTHPSIQEAIDEADDHDVICVDSGTYTENLDFLGKSVNVVGLQGWSSTIIHGDYVGPVVTFASGEDADASLEGFWLKYGGEGPGGHGGGVYIDGASPTLVDVHVSYNTITGNGGGIYVSGGSPSFDGVQVTDCNAENGGGIYLESSGAIMQDVVIQDTLATQGGGGMYVIDSSPIIEDLQIVDTIADVSGGGILAANSPVILQYAEVVGCSASTGHGGGIALQSSDVDLYNVILADNESAQGTGGGLAAQDCAPLVTNTVVSNNWSYMGGGGMILDDTGAWLSNVKVLGNVSMGAGAGVYVLGGSPSIYNTAAHANDANGFGGGIYATGSASVTLVNTALTFNVASAGAGLYCDGCSMMAESCNAFGNANDNYGGITDPTGQDGNLSQNPLYLSTVASNPLYWDLHLAGASPQRDAGTAGVPDPDGGDGDIGAYGGTYAGQWDLDHDGYLEWWMPGNYNYGTYPGQGWDCADQDASAYPGSGC